MYLYVISMFEYVIQRVLKDSYTEYGNYHYITRASISPVKTCCLIDVITTFAKFFILQHIIAFL